MSIQKTLCLICETPTADGAVSAVHVDQDKLQTWFLNVCEYEIDDEINDDDLICYYCLWHAEFLWKFNGMSDEALVWWNLELDDAATELRKHYLEGNIEQCWVALEEVDLPESEEYEIDKDVEGLESAETKSNISSEKKKCLYCGKLFTLSHNLSQHVKKTHKNAIRCESHNCATYFHTFEEREKHKEEVHKLKIFKCYFCNKKFIGNNRYSNHVRQIHREFPVKCAFKGCVSFFKTKIEMRAHFHSLHKIDGSRMIDCEYCEYKTRKKFDLQRHVARNHRTEKPFKCDECGAMFSTKDTLASHCSSKHVFKRCKICKSEVSVRIFFKHIRKVSCDRCKNEFQCSGLYQSHMKSAGKLCSNAPCVQRAFNCPLCLCTT